MTNQKPLTIIRAEFINNLVKLINESNLPAFIIEPIFKDMLNDIHTAAEVQYEQDKQQYEQSLTLQQDHIEEEKKGV